MLRIFRNTDEVTRVAKGHEVSSLLGEPKYLRSEYFPQPLQPEFKVTCRTHK